MQLLGISLQQRPNDSRSRRLTARATGGETSALRPLLGGRIENDYRFAPMTFADDGPSPLAFSTFFGGDNGRRSRRHDDRNTAVASDSDNTDGQGRLLSPSAFSRISETLGALNTVGNFLVNFTRGENSHYHQMHSHGGGHGSPSNDHRPIDHLDAETLTDERPMQMISSSSSMDATSVPDAILTLTKNVLGQNMTKTIEPLIKRVGMITKVETAQAPHAIMDKLDTDTNKRKKHETVTEKVAEATTTAVVPGKYISA